MPSFPTNLIHQICFSVTFLNFLKVKIKLKNTKEEIHCNITPESRTTTTNIKIVQRSMWRWAWIRTLSLFFLWVYSSNTCANEIWVCMSWFSWTRYFINLLLMRSVYPDKSADVFCKLLQFQIFQESLSYFYWIHIKTCILLQHRFKYKYNQFSSESQIQCFKANKGSLNVPPNGTMHLLV